MLDHRAVNNPNDPGGRTVWGIAERFHPEEWANGVPSRARAKVFYKTEYWDHIAGDQLLAISGAVANEVFEQQVNSGQGAKHLQKSLNLLNRQQKDYPDIAVDGGIGPMTIDMLGRYFKRWGADAETIMLRTLNGYQFMLFESCARSDGKFEEFENGWILKRIEV